MADATLSAPLSRRKLIQTTGGLIGLTPAGAAPAIASLSDPRERDERPIAELRAAFEAYYPRVEVEFNGVSPADMYPKPQPGGWSYGPDCAAVLVFASVDPFERGRWFRHFDSKGYHRSPDDSNQVAEA